MSKKSRNLTPKKQAQAENEAARSQSPSGEEQAGKPDGLCCTTTGEVFQPVRIYYEALKIMKILKVFNNLKCMDFDEARPRWVWLYTGEAAHLGFRKPAVNPKHPVVLGSFIRFYDDLIYLDVNSMERALAAITFFDKHLPRAAARLWYVSLINRVFSHKEAQQFDANQYFDARMEFVDPAEQLTEQLETLSAAAPDDDERMARLQRFFAEREAARDFFAAVRNLSRDLCRSTRGFRRLKPKMRCFVRSKLAGRSGRRLCASFACSSLLPGSHQVDRHTARTAPRRFVLLSFD